MLGEKPVWGKQSAPAVKKRKGRQSTTKSEPSPEPVKRMKKAKEWSPPQGSWEDEIEYVDTVEQRVDPKSGQLVKFGYLRWKNGFQTTHPLPLIYRKLPQKVGPPRLDIALEEADFTPSDAHLLRTAPRIQRS